MTTDDPVLEGLKSLMMDYPLDEGIPKGQPSFGPLPKKPFVEVVVKESPNAPPPPSAVAMLYRAADLIEQRGAERDKPGGERTMADCVQAFWVIFGKGILARGHMTETEGWEFMSILKKVRSAGGGYKEDDYADDIAYAALAAESEAQQH